MLLGAVLPFSSGNIGIISLLSLILNIPYGTDFHGKYYTVSCLKQFLPETDIIAHHCTEPNNVST